MCFIMLSIEVKVPSMMPISIDLHVKCNFYKMWNKKKMPRFFLMKYSHCEEQIAIFYQSLSQGAVKKKK